MLFWKIAVLSEPRLSETNFCAISEGQEGIRTVIYGGKKHGRN